jgi:hypothetical protein
MPNSQRDCDNLRDARQTMRIAKKRGDFIFDMEFLQQDAD